jgi:hypothetical protein
MNKLFAGLALAFIAPLFGSLYAQDDNQASEQYEPPPPVGMDVDYFAPPKQKLSIGFRVLTGPKVAFSGFGLISSGVNPGFDANGIRHYNDGTIAPDTRTDAASPTGAPLQTTVNADGRSDSWTFSNQSQVDTANNGVDMHTYSATINGNNPGSGRAASGAGFELTFDRDFGWHLGRVQIDLIGGIGTNKISYSRTENVAGMMTTNTDVYNTYNAVIDPVSGDPENDTNGNQFYGGVPNGYTATPPAISPGTGTPGTLPAPGAVAPIPTAPTQTPPYTSPSSGTDTNGNTVNNSTIIGSNPVPGDSTTSQPVPTLVTEKWNIDGAYYTLRAGAQVTVPITDKFSASVSGGPALVYVGTTFSVDQTLTPPTGSPITSIVTDTYNTVLPAYFADADVEYSFTDTTGLYLGAVFQSSTSYNQSIHDPSGNYTNRVDFGNQEGVRGGVSFKF